MNTLICLIIGLFLTASQAKAGAFLELTKVNNITSGEIELQLGKRKGLKLGQRILIYLPDFREGMNKVKNYYLGEGQLKTLNENSSTWSLDKVVFKKGLNNAKRVAINFSISDPKSIRITRLKKVSHNNSSAKSVVKNLVRKKNYKADNDLFIKDKKENEKVNENSWAKRNRTSWNNEYDQEVDTYFVPEEDQVFDDYLEKVEDTISSDRKAIEKFNDLNKVSDIYDGTIRDKNNLSNKNTERNSYEENQYDSEQDVFLSPPAIAKIENEGKRWSADLSDEQLRTFFVKSGISEEVKRRQKAFNQKFAHEIVFSLASSISRNTNEIDTSNKGLGYSLSLGHELHLSRSQKLIDRLTLGFEIEKSKNNFEMSESINGTFSLLSFGGHLNWYFWDSPNLIGRLMPYLGLGFKRGSAKASSSLSKEYKYEFLSLPTWRIGLKYRFEGGDEGNSGYQVGTGINLMLTGSISQFSITGNLEDNIYKDFNANQMKFSVGFNLYY